MGLLFAFGVPAGDLVVFLLLRWLLQMVCSVYFAPFVIEEGKVKCNTKQQKHLRTIVAKKKKVFRWTMIAVNV